MRPIANESTQCAVYDQTPGSQQKKINIVVRPHYTVERVINDISTQYSYTKFELLLQPYDNKDLVYLNDLKLKNLYDIDGFVSTTKNFLILLPDGTWDGDVKRRYDLPMNKQQKLIGSPSKSPKINKEIKLTKLTTTTTEITETATTNGIEMAKTTITTATAAAAVDEAAAATTITNTTSTATAAAATLDTITTATTTTTTATTKIKTKTITKPTLTINTTTDNSSGNSSSSSTKTSTTGTKTTKSGKVKTIKTKTGTKTTKKSAANSTNNETNNDNENENEKTTNTKNARISAGSNDMEIDIIAATETVAVAAKTEIAPENAAVPLTSNAAVTEVPATSNIGAIDNVDATTHFNFDLEPLSDDDLALGASASPTENRRIIYHKPNTTSTKTQTTNDTLNSTVYEAYNNNTDSDIDAEPITDKQTKHSASTIDAATDTNEYNNDIVDNATNRIIQSTPEDYCTTSAASIDRFYKWKNQLPAELGTTQTTATTTTASVGKNYVGLVNQAMTCYLNSLLQALYMTPEFRNALYRWEFDNDNEAKNIPYQLQKLFLNLQTSTKSSVETTDLTRSFGWDSTEAWQQHDIQELCRVMFDALEHKSKNTKQAHFISNLYEGKMLDYVKCLECNTEKTREDTFLDIPLPVRPFGSSVAYGSIEEALCAFVQPETLDGNNQYLCENCNKKCDAHKGLKFKTFPYILTLHLKRFDFDYQTMHRIKLNDRVTFPQSLNLNSFVNSSETESLLNLQVNGNGHGNTNLDDCSTADSGSAMEEDNLSSGVVTTASSSQHENDMMNDEDEGIDMSTSTDHRLGATSPHKSAAVERIKQESGPYLYELFAIMIHAGSASGGHYYAYIKDFDNNEWFCFNDQSVQPITQEDIQKSFGGGSSNAYYSSVYSSSTNAYMLMYRQVDPKRNEHTIKEPEFPLHIKTLLPKLQGEEEARHTRIGRHTTITDLALPDLDKPRVYFYNPSYKKMKMARVYVSQSVHISHILESAHEMLDVEKFAPLSCCRLVAYDSTSEEIIQSLENISDPSLKELRAAHNFSLDFLLEYRAEGQEFEPYVKNGKTWHVYMVNLTSMEMDGPFLVYSPPSHEQNDEALRHAIAVRLHIKEDEFLLATLRGEKAYIAYDPMPTPEAQEQLQNIATTQFKYITYFYLNVPSTDAANLEVMGIPTNEIQINAAPNTAQTAAAGVDVVDAVMLNGSSSSTTLIGDTAENYQYNRASPLPPIPTPGHESNSEDSSLSDGDRTLVESIQNRGGGDSQVSSTSHSPQLSSPEDEAATHDSYMRIHAFYNGYNAADPLCASSSHTNNSPQFFYASKLEAIDLPTSNHSSLSNDDDALLRKPVQSYKLLVSSHMRMVTFKRHIQQLIQVPCDCFELHRKNEDPISTNPTNSLVFLNEGETLTVELGKIPQLDEYKAKIYYMRLSELDNDTGKLPRVCDWVYNTTTTAEMAKRELVAKFKRIDANKYEKLTYENCRLWLKGGRSPIKILANDEPLYNDVRTTVATEFIVQECDPGVKAQPNEDSLTILLRRWHPDKLQFDKFQEITLEADSEIRNAISKITDIPEENIAYTKMNSTFPGTNISVLSVNSSMSWFSIPATVDKYPLTATSTGNIYFYKDVTKTAKELTNEERSDLSAKEKARLDRLFSISTSRYSPRRERALKIYLDSPQKSTTTTGTATIDAGSGLCKD